MISELLQRTPPSERLRAMSDAKAFTLVRRDVPVSDADPRVPPRPCGRPPCTCAKPCQPCRGVREAVASLA